MYSSFNDPYADSSIAVITGDATMGSSSASCFYSLCSTCNFLADPTARANFRVIGSIITVAVPALGTPALATLGMPLAAAGVLLARSRNRATI
jgi:hypothetical protein